MKKISLNVHSFLWLTIRLLGTGNDFEDPASDLGDLRFRISYAGGIDTVKQAMERFHRFWPTWLGRIRKEGGH